MMGNRAVPKQPCPYGGCGCPDEVWFWGWYHREGREILEALGVDSFRLRRFKCCACGRTYSWRPPFLAFARHLVAQAYQRPFKSWALGCRSSYTGVWHELGESGIKAFRRVLNDRLSELRGRMRRELGIQQAPRLEPLSLQRQKLWYLIRHVSRKLRRVHKAPRLSCQTLFLALARHRCDHSSYRLSST
jgi:hypothetical protein